MIKEVSVSGYWILIHMSIFKKKKIYEIAKPHKNSSSVYRIEREEGGVCVKFPHMDDIRISLKFCKFYYSPNEMSLRITGSRYHIVCNNVKEDIIDFCEFNDVNIEIIEDVKFQVRNNLINIMKTEFPNWKFEDRYFYEKFNKRHFEIPVCMYFDKELKKLDKNIVLGYNNLINSANCAHYLISHRRNLDHIIDLYVSTIGPFYRMKFFHLSNFDKYIGLEIQESELPDSVGSLRIKIGNLLKEHDYKMLKKHILDTKVDGYVNSYSDDSSFVGTVSELVFTCFNDLPWNIDYDQILIRNELCDDDGRLLPEFKKNFKKIDPSKSNEIHKCPVCKKNIVIESPIRPVEVTCKECGADLRINNYNQNYDLSH
jgi:ribosomal protein L37AE/L43A